VGEVAAADLKKTLSTALMQAIQDEGIEKAIGVCSAEAVSLTARIAEQSEAIESVKRTSFKFRNPANAPDLLEAAALTYFEDTLRKTGELPAFHIQKVESGHGTHFRYYQPLQVNSLCVTCHGERDDIAPTIRALLGERYPNDQAVGYHVGDLRGIIRVSVTVPR
jgi:hypothetical protein